MRASFFFNISLLVVSMLVFTTQNTYAEPYGPSIKGFQLGMNIDQVEQVAEKNGLYFLVAPINNMGRSTGFFLVQPGSWTVIRVADGHKDENISYPGVTGFGESLKGKQVPKLWEYCDMNKLYDKEGKAVIDLKYENKVLSSFNFPSYGLDVLFNAVGSRKGFLEALSKNYHFNFDAYGVNGVPKYYEYKNTKEGFKVNCKTNVNTEVSDMKIEAIPKESGNFSF